MPGGMTAGGMTAGGMTAGGRRRRRGRGSHRRLGRGFLGGRLRRRGGRRTRRGRGFFDTVKKYGKKALSVATNPKTLALAKKAYQMYKSHKSGSGVRRINYRKMRGRGLAYNSFETAGPLP